MNLIFKIGSKFLINSMKKDRKKDYLIPDESYHLERDLPYIDDGDIKHTFNIYHYLKNDKNKGLIIHIHGGGWIYGDKMYGDPYYVYLCKKGFDVVTLSYPLIPNVTLPQQIISVYRGVKYILQNGEKFHLDTSKVMLSGDSAGGHLALLSYCLLSFPNLSKIYHQEVVSHHIEMLSLLHPCLEVHQILGLLHHNKNYYFDKKIEEVFFDGYKKSPYYNHSSLSDIVNEGDFPFIYLLTSLGDDLNEHTFLAKELLEKNLHNKVHLTVVKRDKNLGHVFEINKCELPESQNVNDEMLNFFVNIDKK